MKAQIIIIFATVLNIFPVANLTSFSSQAYAQEFFRAGSIQPNSNQFGKTFDDMIRDYARSCDEKDFIANMTMNLPNLTVNEVRQGAQVAAVLTNRREEYYLNIWGLDENKKCEIQLNQQLYWRAIQNCQNGRHSVPQPGPRPGSRPEVIPVRPIPLSSLVTCETFSRGLTFSKTDTSETLARQQLSSECTSDNRTNNTECTTNIACSNQPAPRIVNCNTFSNGITFEKFSRSGTLSRQLLTSDCTSDNRTNNAECTANIYCDDQPETPIIKCNTFSNGLTFEKYSRSGTLTRQLLSSSCTSDNRTNNSECTANIACNNQPENPVITCFTFSQGLKFNKSERSETLARNLAISSCTSDNRTNNTECSTNIACNNSAPQPIVTCRTFSRGLSFEMSERSESLARQLSISQCTSNSSTNNQECATNVECHIKRLHP